MTYKDSGVWLIYHSLDWWLTTRRYTHRAFWLIPQSRLVTYYQEVYTVLSNLPQSRLVTFWQEVYTQCCLTYLPQSRLVTYYQEIYSQWCLTYHMVTYCQEIYTQWCLTYHSPDWSLTARRYTHSAVWLTTVQTGHLLPGGIHTVLSDLAQSRLVTYYQEVYTQCCLTYHSPDWSLTTRRYTHSTVWLTTVQTGRLLSVTLYQAQTHSQLVLTQHAVGTTDM